MTYSLFLLYVKQAFKRTDKDTEIARAYNDTIMDIASRMPHGGYKYQSYVPTVVAQEDYPLPSTLLHLYHPIRLLDGHATEDSGIQLEHITKEEYDRRELDANKTSPETGYPSAYTVYSRSILLTPIPDDVYLVELNWTKLPVDQSEDNPTHTLGDEYNEVLKWGTLFRLYMDLELYQEAANYRALYEDDTMGLGKLMRKERDLEGYHIGRVANNSL